ncbi:MAG: hypothetical protein K6G65_00425 [Lachnospiraceae bacterium]|nr:hypothetical protein [Lachnospiraceae bacterium]
MTIKLIQLVVLLVAASFVMIWHEIVRSIVYYIMNRADKKELKILVAPHHYIDPVGLLFAAFGYSPFSKSFAMILKKKKHATILGISGCMANIFMFLMSLCALIFLNHSVVGTVAVNSTAYYAVSITVWFCQYLFILSVGCFVTNLFPIATFDMGLIIAGVSYRAFYGVLSNDSLFKTLYFLAVILGVVQNACIVAFKVFVL